MMVGVVLVFDPAHWQPFAVAFAGFALAAIAGFVAPAVLTAGWNGPMPSNAHLRLVSRRAQKALLWLSFALIAAVPSVARMTAA